MNIRWLAQWTPAYVIFEREATPEDEPQRFAKAATCHFDDVSSRHISLFQDGTLRR